MAPVTTLKTPRLAAQAQDGKQALLCLHGDSLIDLRKAPPVGCRTGELGGHVNGARDQTAVTLELGVRGVWRQDDLIARVEWHGAGQQLQLLGPRRTRSGLPAALEIASEPRSRVNVLSARTPTTHSAFNFIVATTF